MKIIVNILGTSLTFEIDIADLKDFIKILLEVLDQLKVKGIGT